MYAVSGVSAAPYPAVQWSHLASHAEQLGFIFHPGLGHVALRKEIAEYERLPATVAANHHDIDARYLALNAGETSIWQVGQEACAPRRHRMPCHQRLVFRHGSLLVSICRRTTLACQTRQHDSQ
jgi:hypothetical protein